MDEIPVQLKSGPLAQHEDKESAAIIYSGHWMISDVNGYESDDEASSSTTATAPSSPIPSPENLTPHQNSNLIEQDNILDSSACEKINLAYNMDTDHTSFDNQNGTFINLLPSLSPHIVNNTFHNAGNENQSIPNLPINDQLIRSDSNCTLRQSRMATGDKSIQAFLIRSKTCLSIDENLSRLFKCMTLAYTEKPASPRWNWFRGLKLQLKDKLRLNNLIWRAWHMQFIFHVKPPVCQFDVSLDESLPQMIILEGSYWKRRLDTVTAEYRKWRITMKERLHWQNKHDGSPKRTFKLNHKLPNILKSTAFYHQSSHCRNMHARHATPLIATINKCASPSLLNVSRSFIYKEPTSTYQNAIIGPTWNVDRFGSLSGKDLLDTLSEENWDTLLDGGTSNWSSNNYYNTGNEPSGSYLDSLSTFEDLYDDVLFSNLLFGPTIVTTSTDPLNPNLVHAVNNSTASIPPQEFLSPGHHNCIMRDNKNPTSQLKMNEVNDEYFNIYGRMMGVVGWGSNVRSESLCVPFPDPKKLLSASSAARRDNGISYDPGPVPISNYATEEVNNLPNDPSSTPVTKKSRMSYSSDSFPSHLVQPGLTKLQPNVESYMETLESLEEILETTKRSYRHIYGHLQENPNANRHTNKQSEPVERIETPSEQTFSSTLAVTTLSSYFTTLLPPTTTKPVKAARDDMTFMPQSSCHLNESLNQLWNVNRSPNDILTYDQSHPKTSKTTKRRSQPRAALHNNNLAILPKTSLTTTVAPFYTPPQRDNRSSVYTHSILTSTNSTPFSAQTSPCYQQILIPNNASSLPSSQQSQPSYIICLIPANYVPSSTPLLLPFTNTLSNPPINSTKHGLNLTLDSTLNAQRVEHYLTNQTLPLISQNVSLSAPTTSHDHDESSDNDSGCVAEIMQSIGQPVPTSTNPVQQINPFSGQHFGSEPSPNYFTLLLPSKSVPSTTVPVSPITSTSISYRKIAPAPNPVPFPPWYYHQNLIHVPTNTTMARSQSFSSTYSTTSTSSASRSHNVAKLKTITRTNSISACEKAPNISDAREKLSHSDIDNSLLRRRSGHINAEHKRRFHIKSGFDSLCTSIPSLCNNSGQKASKVAILNHAAVYVRHLRRKISDTDANLRSLKLQIATLNREISYYQSAMPSRKNILPQTGLQQSCNDNIITQRDIDRTSNPALSFVHFLKMDKALSAQNYRTYVRGKSSLNWRYYLFSLITNHLFETYNEFVSTATIEELCSNVVSWLEQFCLLPILRPIVTKLMVNLSKKSSILTDPNKFPEELLKLSQTEDANYEFL